MTLKTKIYIALTALALIAAVVIISSRLIARREEKLSRAVDTAKHDAETAEKAARQLELKATEYKQKIEYLEDSLSALRLIASRQDEQLKTLESATNDARHNVSRARAVRSLESSTAELCAKLAELGHACE